MAKVALIFVLMAIVLIPSWCNIWERKPWQRYGRNYLNRYQFIPKRQETAMKLMKYFLDRDPQRLSKRAVENGIFYDVTFVLDSSGSVGSKEFKNAILALQTLITRAKENTLYAGLTFSTVANITFNFTRPLQSMKLLGKTVYIPGMTNTQQALEKCRLDLFLNKASGVRRLSYKRILIVTDGQSNVEKQKTLYNAFRLKNMGIEIFVIAIGKYLKGIAEIVGLASSTDAHLYRVRNMKGLLEIIHLIPPWQYLREQQKTWLENMFEDMDDRLKYVTKRHR